MRAIMEGISFALLEILSIMEETIGAAANIYASGGFIRSEKWKQLLADVLGEQFMLRMQKILLQRVRQCWACWRSD